MVAFYRAYEGRGKRGMDKTMYNEERNDMYPSPIIVRVIKSRKKYVGGVCSTYGGE